MSERIALSLPKWPFIVGDLLLLGVAYWIVQHYPHPLPTWPLFYLFACTAGGAWLAVTPFLVEYRARLKFAEADNLTTAVEQINNLRNLVNQISFATAQWQVVQEHSGRTVEEARTIADKMVVEAKSFAEFMQKANDTEKAHLRLEVEKLRRGEGQWVEILAHMLDHIYALYRAGLRSNQPVLIQQLTHFQAACRDAVRRVGLVAYEAAPDGLFNEEQHQLPDADAKPAEGAKVTETLAPGFTYQGQMLRRALVSVSESSAAVESQDEQLPLGTS